MLKFSAAVLMAFAAMTTGNAQEHNTLTDAEKAAGWKLLFDGKTTSGWRGFKLDTLPAEWRVVDGLLLKGRPTGDIVTTEQFGDFELTLDWRLGARRGNAGIFYRATEDYDRVYWSAPEYQLGTDSTPDTRNPLTAPGAVYGFYPAKPGSWKNFGEWNTTRIVVKGSHAEHWLNGQKIAEYDYWSPDFEAKYKASKFAPYDKFARATKGFIAIQGDHAGELALRNVKIRELR